MGEPDEIDPYGVVPDGFCEAWGEESIPAALEAAERASGTTDRSEKPRCPACRVSTRIRKKSDKLEMPHQIDVGYKCGNPDCTAHFDDPAPPFEECPIETAWIWLADNQHRRENFIKTMPINTGFDWCTDLKDPDERGFSPLFEGLDEDTRTALAIRLYRPDEEAGPSYRELAELFPHGRAWIGARVRAWREGDYRDLVEEPAPSVDDTGADAIATDGGERDRRRWRAFR